MKKAAITILCFIIVFTSGIAGVNRVFAEMSEDVLEEMLLDEELPDADRKLPGEDYDFSEPDDSADEPEENEDDPAEEAPAADDEMLF